MTPRSKSDSSSFSSGCASHMDRSDGRRTHSEKRRLDRDIRGIVGEVGESAAPVSVSLSAPVSAPAPASASAEEAERHHARAILSLAWPVYVELLASVVAGIIDVAWVAHLGPSQTAAVAVATNLENLVIGVALIAQGGTTVLMARRIAADDRSGVRAAIRGGWLLLSVPTTVLVIGGLLARHTIAGLFFGAGTDATGLLIGYLAISIPGLAVLFAQTMVDSILKGLGDTKTPMRLAISANLVILVLDPLLIYGLAGLPRLGIQGAAIATVTGRAVALTVGAILLRRRDVASTVTSDVAKSPARRPAIKAADTKTPVHRSALEVARVGAPMGGDFMVRMTGSLAVITTVSGFGVVAVAAYGIGVKAMYFASMGFYAIRQAATIHTARSAPQEHEAIGRDTLRIALACGATAAALYAAAAPWIMRAFTSQHAVIATGTTFLRRLGLYLIPLACVIGLSGVLLAASRGTRLLAVTIAGTITLIALAPALSAVRALNLSGVYLAMTISALFQWAALIAMWRTKRPGATASAGTRP
jgi:putative MATE family efflux protein